MYSTKILFGLAVLTIFCITYSESIACYSCTDKKSCKKPSKYECTAYLATNTKNYLVQYHKNVPNVTSPYYECFREYHKSSNGEFHFKGCIYSNIEACKLEMKDIYVQGKFERSCDKCGGKNYCNPAGHAKLSLGLPIVTISLAVLAKYLWSK